MSRLITLVAIFAALPATAALAGTLTDAQKAEVREIAVSIAQPMGVTVSEVRADGAELHIIGRDRHGVATEITANRISHIVSAVATSGGEQEHASR
ncbi:hypothetical protein D1610_07020 [Sphingomonas gilva]|uniref:PepSY domain-containing protein n=1 Tax=Sphingomonas gilva TaxID=2305907 RepID=A0A396S479_9SPHN|nr:PepSY domain-containing protein [Sphingomonas gilva]RHW18225.1 hypothetical protein D1610_07020 [Sphingomonas gilva]